MIYDSIIFISIVGWSITNILVNGIILDPIRNYTTIKFPILSKLLTCIQCSGFWVGAGIGLISYYGIIYNVLFYFVNPENLYSLPLTILIYGFWNSGVSVIYNSLLFFLHSFNKKRRLER